MSVIRNAAAVPTPPDLGQLVMKEKSFHLGMQ